jgi:hypothetical protein
MVRSAILIAISFLLIGLTTQRSNVTLGQGGGKITGGEVTTGPYTPERGSAERKAIVDALRVPIEKQLKRPVIFKIEHLKVQQGWAFMRAVPQQPDGSRFDYTGTVYQAAQEAGAFDDGIVALLRNVNGKWKVVQFVIGATDVPYVDWDKKYRAPKGIFGME